MLTKAQVAWAKTHDWFQWDNGDGTIVIVDRWSQLQRDGEVTYHDDFQTWTGTFKDLRAWAGY